jgi:hypothetical protein
MKIHSVIICIMCMANFSCDSNSAKEKVYSQANLEELDENHNSYEKSREIFSQIADTKIDLFSGAIVILEKDTLDTEEYKNLFRLKTNTLKDLYTELSKIEGLTRNDLNKLQTELSDQLNKFEDVYREYLSLIDKRNFADKKNIGEIEFVYKQASINEFDNIIKKVFP